MFADVMPLPNFERLRKHPKNLVRAQVLGVIKARAFLLNLLATTKDVNLCLWFCPDAQADRSWCRKRPSTA